MKPDNLSLLSNSLLFDIWFDQNGSSSDSCTCGWANRCRSSSNRLSGPTESECNASLRVIAKKSDDPWHLPLSQHCPSGPGQARLCIRVENVLYHMPSNRVPRQVHKRLHSKSCERGCFAIPCPVGQNIEDFLRGTRHLLIQWNSFRFRQHTDFCPGNNGKNEITWPRACQVCVNDNEWLWKLTLDDRERRRKPEKMKVKYRIYLV